MAGVAHFSILVLVVAAGAAWTYRNYEPPNGGRIIASFTLGPGLALAAGLLAIHACAFGQPIQQWVVPGLVMSGVLCCTAHSRAKGTVLTLLFGVAIGLSFHYAHLVHGKEWIGVERSLGADKQLIDGQREWHTHLTGLYRRDRPKTEPP